MNTAIIMAQLDALEEKIQAKNKAIDKYNDRLKAGQEEKSRIEVDLPRTLSMLFSTDTEFPILYQALCQRFQLTHPNADNDDYYDDDDDDDCVWKDDGFSNSSEILTLCLLGAGIHNPEQINDLLAFCLHPAMYRNLKENGELEGISILSHTPISDLLEHAHGRIAAARGTYKIGVLSDEGHQEYEEGITQILYSRYSDRKLTGVQRLLDIQAQTQMIMKEPGKFDHLIIEKALTKTEDQNFYTFRISKTTFAELLKRFTFKDWESTPAKKKEFFGTRRKIKEAMTALEAKQLIIGFKYVVSGKAGAYKLSLKAMNTDSEATRLNRSENDYYDGRAAGPRVQDPYEALNYVSNKEKPKVKKANQKIYTVREPHMTFLNDLVRDLQKAMFTSTVDLKTVASKVSVFDGDNSDMNIAEYADQVLTEVAIAELEKPVAPAETAAIPAPPAPEAIPTEVKA